MQPGNLPFENEIAAKARELILADFSIYDTIEQLADKLSISASTLKRVFKAAYGESIPVFSRRVRIEEAQRLLLTTNYTLSGIAAMTGYSEGSTFQATFKQLVGIPPGEWRRDPANHH